ncbi:MAG: hypothetical protein R3E68_12750 [Burkholderiaceae bacterium]
MTDWPWAWLDPGAWQWLGQTAPSRAMRGALWLYPLVNGLHLLGMALLIGPILVLDWRLLRHRAGDALEPLARHLLPFARAGFGIAVPAGLLMFIARPGDYVANGLFQAKLCLLAAALVNIVVLHRSAGWRQTLAGGTPSRRVRVAAALSASLWLAVLFLGRLIGYR